MVNEARIKFKKDGDEVVSMARDVEKQAATVSDEGSLTQFTVAILEALHYQNFHSPKG